MDELLSLERYAFVTAALSEGYTLADVLEREGLSEDAWESAEEAWVERLQASAATDLALNDALDRALAAARARFTRRIMPLDVDVTAFLIFQRHASSAPRLLPFLLERGLFLGDWVRLTQAWASLLAVDGQLRSLAVAVLGDEQPRVPPTIEADPPVWPARAPDRPVRHQAMEAAGEPIEEAPAWGLAELREAGASARAAPSFAPVRSPGTAQSFSPNQVESMSPLSLSLALATGMDHGPTIDATTQAPEMRGVGLRAEDAESPEEDTLDPVSLRRMRATLPFMGASGAAPLVAGPSVPFEDARDERPRAIAVVLEDETTAPPQTLPTPGNRQFVPECHAVDLAPTITVSDRRMRETSSFSLADLVAAGPALPFHAPVAAPMATNAHAANAPADGIAVSTSATPFSPASPDPRNSLVRTGALPVSEAWEEKTAPRSAPHSAPDADEMTLPLQRSPLRAAMPFQPKGEPTASLTLERYAALCATLQESSEDAEVVFARFGLVSPMARITVDLAWQARLRRDIGLYRQYQDLHAQYRAALRRRGGPPRSNG